MPQRANSLPPSDTYAHSEDENYELGEEITLELAIANSLPEETMRRLYGSQASYW
jgi:hypothetical protein